MNHYNYRQGAGHVTFSPYQKDYNSFRSYPNKRGYERAVNKATKHSGCRFHSGVKTKKGDTIDCISGWNYSKNRGLVSIIAGPRRKGYKEIPMNNGNHYITWVAKMFFKRTGQTAVIGCLYNRTTGKLIIPDMGMVMNPKAPNGGYVGTFKKS